MMSGFSRVVSSADRIERSLTRQARPAIDVRRRVQRDFQDTVALTAEQFERFPDLVETEVVRDERRQVDMVLGDHRHQPPHALPPGQSVVTIC